MSLFSPSWGPAIPFGGCGPNQKPCNARNPSTGRVWAEANSLSQSSSETRMKGDGREAQRTLGHHFGQFYGSDNAICTVKHRTMACFALVGSFLVVIGPSVRPH